MFELFEVFNEKGNRVFFTIYDSCIPSKDEIDIMTKNGYKFKANGKFLTKKAINKLLKKG